MSKQIPKKRLALMDYKPGVPGEKPGIVTVPDALDGEDGKKVNLVAYYVGDTPEGCKIYEGLPRQSSYFFLSPHEFRAASTEEVSFYKLYHIEMSASSQKH